MNTAVWPEFEPIIKKGGQAVPLEQMPLQAARETMDRALIRWAGKSARGCVVSDLVVPSTATQIPVRVYTPAASIASARPAILMFHGGGFVLGSLDAQDALAHRVAAGTDCVVISVDYRRAPENPFPAAVDDGFAVYLWVHASADALGIDAARVGVLGESAGATIATAVALKARHHGRPPTVAFLAYPPLSASLTTQSWQRLGSDYWLTRDTMTWFWRQYLGAEPHQVDEYAQPLHAQSLFGFPSTILITGSLDPLCDEIAQFHKRLREAGVAVNYEVVDGAVHGFLSMSAISSRADNLLNQYIASLRPIVHSDSTSTERVLPHQRL
jgi:acetyl esterase